MEERNLKWGGLAIPRPEGPMPAAAFINFFLLIPLFSTEKWGGQAPPAKKVGGLGPPGPSCSSIYGTRTAYYLRRMKEDIFLCSVYQSVSHGWYLYAKITAKVKG